MAKLVLLRHGESLWNKKNVFTGWVDVPLSQNGINEAIKAGEQLTTIDFDIAFTSVQVRAIETAMLALAQHQNDHTPVIIHRDGKMKDWTQIYDQEMRDSMIPVYCEWQLNERYYGELQGKNKAKTADEFGEEQVRQWRRSYDIQPPNGECLKDTAERTIPLFKQEILPQLEQGKNVLIAAHGNSLRSIIMYIEKLSSDEIVDLELPTGTPLYYDYAAGELQKTDS